MYQELSIPELTEVVARVARVAALLGPREGVVMELEGGIANRNFRVRFAGTEYVLGLPGDGDPSRRVGREAERAANTRAGELGIAPPVTAFIDDPSCLVTRFVDGRRLREEELREPAAIATVAGALRAFHDSDLQLDATYDSSGDLPDPVPCHNHLMNGSFLHDGRGILIVDWELAAMGNRYHDLASVAACGDFQYQHEEQLLAEYFGEPATDERRSTLGAFRSGL